MFLHRAVCSWPGRASGSFRLGSGIPTSPDTRGIAQLIDHTAVGADPLVNIQAGALLADGTAFLEADPRDPQPRETLDLSQPKKVSY